MPARITFAVLAAIAIAACHLAIAPAAAQSNKPRLWTDASGSFEVRAELIDVDLKSKRIKLRKRGGEEVVVPIAKLSAADRRFLRDEMKRRESDGDGEGSSGEPAIEGVDGLLAKTKSFYEDLRTTERDAAKEMLTDEAVNGGGAAAVAALPTPDKRASAIKLGKPEASGSTAAVPVRVKVSGRTAKTKLHFRRVEDAWRVFAISATMPDGEKTINFETAADRGEQQDPLLALVGQPMPLTGMMLNGRSFDIQQLQGKLVLVDFWATWCGPCRAEMKNVAENYQKYNTQGFEVVAVSIDRNMADLQKFQTDQPMPWVVLADRHPQNRQSMAQQYGISGIPALVLVGRDGKVLAAHCRGKRLGEEIEKALSADRKVASRTAEPPG